MDFRWILNRFLVSSFGFSKRNPRRAAARTPKGINLENPPTWPHVFFPGGPRGEKINLGAPGGISALRPIAAPWVGSHGPWFSAARPRAPQNWGARAPHSGVTKTVPYSLGVPRTSTPGAEKYTRFLLGTFSAQSIPYLFLCLRVPTVRHRSRRTYRIRFSDRPSPKPTAYRIPFVDRPPPKPTAYQVPVADSPTLKPTDLAILKILRVVKIE